MSDERNEHPDAERRGAPAEPVLAEETSPWTPPPSPAEPPAYQGRQRSWTLLWLAGLLVVIVAGVLSSPFWAAAVRPLLPWGQQSNAARYDALARRVAALEARPVAPPIDAEAIKSAQTALAQKITALENGVAELRQSQQVAATKSALAQQSQRLDAAQARSAARAAEQTAAIEKIRQELAQRSTAGGELATRIEALEHQVHAQGNADRSQTLRLLALLQMREALEAGQPFAAEYAAFSRLAARDPELADAARPLADAARDGVASLAELHRRLAAIADQISRPKASPAASGWWDEALGRMRALVTIRRIDTSAADGPEAAVDAAQTALIRGDLAGAVSALDGLSGAHNEAVEPWLKLARQRLAAEAALRRLQMLLTAQLSAPTDPPAATAPAPERATPPAAPKTPS